VTEQTGRGTEQNETLFSPHNQWQVGKFFPQKPVKAGGAFGFVLHKSRLLAKAAV
jgi:hypothetical protein